SRGDIAVTPLSPSLPLPPPESTRLPLQAAPVRHLPVSPLERVHSRRSLPESQTQPSSGHRCFGLPGVEPEPPFFEIARHRSWLLLQRAGPSAPARPSSPAVGLP